MSTTKIALSPTAVDGHRLRRAGWFLIGSFLGFVVFVATMIATSNGYDAALNAAAEERGVSLNDLPAEAVAPINHEYNEIGQGVLLLVLIMLALALYIAGVRLATAVGHGVIRRVSVLAAAVMPLCWLVIFALDYALGTDDPDRWFGFYDAAYNRAIAVSTVAGSLALLGVLVLLRRVGVARRTGLVVGALAVLTIVAAVAFGAPPVVPLLLAAIVGIVMVRTARSVEAG